MVEPLQDSSSPSGANNRNTQFKEYVNASLPTLEASAVPNREINKKFGCGRVEGICKGLKIPKIQIPEQNFKRINQMHIWYIV